MTQRDLFGAAVPETVPDHAPYVRGSTTSELAAERIKPNAGTLRAEVLAALEDAGEAGRTDEELQRALAMNPSTQRPRRIELLNDGLIRDSGRTRPTASGRQAVVWVVSGRAGE